MEQPVSWDVEAICLGWPNSSYYEEEVKLEDLQGLYQHYDSMVINF